jgi:ribosome-associated heat shock protein Hsp15
MRMTDTERIDKYLWAIRVFKTRGQAADACRGGKVKIGGINAKPSRLIKIGDVVEVRKGPVLYSYRIKGLTEHRVGAKAVQEFAENLTPEAELAKLKAPVETFFTGRDRGAGRPTKKERRILEQAWDQLDKENVIGEIPDEIAERFGLSDGDL